MPSRDPDAETRRPRIGVVGAGLSGLTLAYRLDQQCDSSRGDVEIVVFESTDRVGGKVGTIRRDGYFCEIGPNGFLSSRRSIEKLCRDIGLADELIAAGAEAKRRYIIHDGKLKPIPQSIASFLFSDLLTLRQKARLFAEPSARKRPSTDESVFDFFTRRFGGEFAERVIDAVATGIYAGDSHRLSLRSCFPELDRLEREHGGILRGLLVERWSRRKKGTSESFGRLTAPAAGMGRTVERLREILEKSNRVTFQLGSPVFRLDRDAAGGYRIQRLSGDSFAVDAVALTTPAFAQAAIVRSLDHRLAGSLAEIEYRPATVVCLGYRRDQLAREPDGFGYLSPYSAGRLVLGVIWTGSIYKRQSPEGTYQFRAILRSGGRIPSADDQDSTEQMIARSIQAVDAELRSFGLIKAKADLPIFREVVEWGAAIPQYVVGHQDRLNRIAVLLAELPGLYLTGAGFRGASVDGVVADADTTAERIMNAIRGKGETPIESD